MGLKTIQISTCNLCGTEEQQELIPGVGLAGWAVFRIKNPKDLREKIICVVCPSCVKQIATAAAQSQQQNETPPPAPPGGTGEVARLPGQVNPGAAED